MPNSFNHLWQAPFLSIVSFAKNLVPNEKIDNRLMTGGNFLTKLSRSLVLHDRYHFNYENSDSDNNAINEK